jgi:Family of unknown function (DUF6731)
MLTGKISELRPPCPGIRMERCHFAYRTDLEALALQSSRYVKSTTFESYVMYVEGMPFEMPLIIRRGAYHKFLKMRTIASVAVKIENPPDGAEFKRLQDPGVSAMADLLTNFGAAKIDVTLKRENRGYVTLSIDGIKHFVDRILNRRAVSESVTSLVINGKREDEEKLEAIDLIEDRLTFEDTVKYDKQRRLDPAECEMLVINALEHHARALQREEE